MASSAYILVSFVVYLFEIYPSYMHSKELPEYKRHLMDQIWINKALRKWEKPVFYIGTINFILCCVLLLLKLVGVIEWW